MITKHVCLDFNWGLLENNYSYVEILFEIASYVFFIEWFVTIFRKHVTISKLCSQINSPRIWKVDNVTHIARCTAIIYRKQFVVHISVYTTLAITTAIIITAGDVKLLSSSVRKIVYNSQRTWYIFMSLLTIKIILSWIVTEWMYPNDHTCLWSFT